MKRLNKNMMQKLSKVVDKNEMQDRKKIVTDYVLKSFGEYLEKNPHPYFDMFQIELSIDVNEIDDIINKEPKDKF